MCLRWIKLMTYIKTWLVIGHIYYQSSICTKSNCSYIECHIAPYGDHASIEKIFWWEDMQDYFQWIHTLSLYISVLWLL